MSQTSYSTTFYLTQSQPTHFEGIKLNLIGFDRGASYGHEALSSKNIGSVKDALINKSKGSVFTRMTIAGEKTEAKSIYTSRSDSSKVLSYGQIWVDTDLCTVTYEGTIIPLFPKEYQLLLLFLKYPNQVLSYDFIIEQLWEIRKTPTHSSIRSHIKGLRKAFRKTNNKDIIENVHGLGYRLKVQKKDKYNNPPISPSISLMKEFLRMKGIEYLVIDKNCIIRYISPNLSSYSDYPESLQIGIKAEKAFPDLIELKEVFEKIIKQELNNFEIKGKVINANRNGLKYINLSVMRDDCQNLDELDNRLLFVFFEDTCQDMLYKQDFVKNHRAKAC